MNFSLIRTNDDGRGVRTITLARPEKRNALSRDLVNELSAAFASARADHTVRVVVLEADGPAFCAGADLEYMQKLSSATILENEEDSRALANMLYAITTLPQPVIAKVHGPAIAGGCGLATVCDFIIGVRGEAQFGYPEVKMGFVAAIVMVFLVRKLGEARARELLLRGSTLSADEAFTIGLISDVVECAHLDQAVNTLVEDLLGASSSSLALTKQMFTATSGMSVESALSYAASMNAFARATPDFKAGVAKFLQKKKL